MEAAPGSTPYSITVAVLAQLTPVQFDHVGLGFYNSTTHHVEEINYEASSVGGSDSPTLSIQKFTDTATFSARTREENAPGFSVMFFKILDDGTNLNFYWSLDGISFFETFTETIATFFGGGAPDNVGFVLDGNNTDAAAVNAMTVLSWIQGTS